MAPIVDILNGPNLNLLGVRQPEVYGSATLEDVEKACRKLCESLGLSLRFRQSNAEHQLIEWIHQARLDAAALVINPAAYSHTSIAILDALNSCDCPVIEVHISNIHAREPFRHHSYVSQRADGIIIGCGVHGYELAVRQVAHRLSLSSR